MRSLLVACALMLMPLAALAESPSNAGGQVTVPLHVYTQMLSQLGKEPRTAPASYALGQSHVGVVLRERDGFYTAEVNVTLRVETFEDEWTLVPILPAGTVLRQALANGRPAQLVQGPNGLAWSAAKAATTTMKLSYSVDARRSEGGYTLPLPVPVAAATTLGIAFPATGADLAIVPAAGVQIRAGQGVTHFTASVPATSSILISWRLASSHPYAISRADYAGEVIDDAVIWTADYQVELFTEEKVSLPLLPVGVTLSDILIDGESATVLEERGHFAVILEGAGQHRVKIGFQVPVIDNKGPPEAQLDIPRVPISRFSLALPGKKTVKVSPWANVEIREADETTIASANIPMTDGVRFTWTDAIPEDQRSPFRANASLYHAVHAEEGVLHGRATVIYDISHGETSQLTLELPADAQVNRVTAPGGGLSDWTVTEAPVDGRKTVNVFLEVAVKGEFVLEVSYERLLGSRADPDEAIAVPLLSATNVHRQRGMVALLSGQELALKPVTEEQVTRVGENQLPALVRNQITMTVAHTYKYIESEPLVTVQTVTPERRQGKFDAQVDTLISLGDVTMKGAATVEIDVKSGSIMALNIHLPADINVLGVAGPSLRSQQVREADGAQLIALDFTREMEGQFRIEITYERIMESGGGDPVVPTVSVLDAEVEHGRIAVEALTAVEVSASRAKHLSTLDINELPQQLVLKTTNPILMAFRYVHAKPAFELALKITRHKEIDVQVAAIERAVYSSLITRDGLAVTTARLTVRNSRQQFLRLNMPAGSKVWSVFVDGKPEKPAFASDDNGANASAVLVKMINSAVGFPVEIVYATPVDRIGYLGSLSSHLPRPDMVVTESRWNVFLPAGPNYQATDSTMDVVIDGTWANPRRHAAADMARVKAAQQVQMGQPLRLSVPTQGVLFAFEKLYANQSPDAAAFTIRYASADANLLALVASLAATGLLWFAIVAIGKRQLRFNRNIIVTSIGGGVLLLLFTIGYVGTNPVPASGLAIAVALALTAWWAVARWRGRRSASPIESPESTNGGG